MQIIFKCVPNRTLYSILIGTLLTVSIAATAYGESDRTPDAVLARLKAGNERYLKGASIHARIDRERRIDTALNGQNPYSTVLGCSDARVPVEVIFDQGFAEVFVIRVAGNVCGTAELATAEYGAQYLGTSLLVVLGHSKCGAVEGAVAGKKLDGSLPELIGMIQPAVEKVKAAHPKGPNDQLVQLSVEENVLLQMETLLRRSDVLCNRVKSGDLKIAGAVRDIKTGKVQWLAVWGQEKLKSL